jgi:signal transduction histidine kinase
MSRDVWELFPYPTLAAGGFVDGSLIATHPACGSCPTQACTVNDRATPGEPQTCRFGVTYARIDENRLVTGLVATDASNPSAKLRSRIRLEPERRVKSGDIRNAIARAIRIGPGVVQDFDRMKQEVLENIERSPEMHRALAEELRRDFEENLQQSHDFLQLVNLVHKHAEVLLLERYPDLPAQDAAEKLPTEGAIYFTTQLMAFKLDSLIYLRESNRATGGEKKFQIHPFVLKYARIYAWQAKEKNVLISIFGECHALVEYKHEAIGAIIQGVLDNLVKYAPSGSKASIRFVETEEHVEVSFFSLGPLIAPNEFSSIFLPGFRAEAARGEELSGQGIGLAAAAGVSDVLGLGLRATQSPTEDEKYAKSL